jgi:hypothetical protein
MKNWQIFTSHQINNQSIVSEFFSCRELGLNPFPTNIFPTNIFPENIFPTNFILKTGCLMM